MVFAAPTHQNECHLLSKTTLPLGAGGPFYVDVASAFLFSGHLPESSLLTPVAPIAQHSPETRPWTPLHPRPLSAKGSPVGCWGGMDSKGAAVAWSECLLHTPY